MQDTGSSPSHPLPAPGGWGREADLSDPTPGDVHSCRLRTGGREREGGFAEEVKMTVFPGARAGREGAGAAAGFPVKLDLRVY